MPQLAQLNIAVLRHPMDHPDLEPFASRLDEVNAQADVAPGFVWRLQDSSGNATDVRPWGPNLIVNLSVWQDLESLKAYMYAPGHVEVMRQRRQFFEPMDAPHVVLWWVPDGHVPTMGEAKERLYRLRAQGPTPDAFPLSQPFPADAVQDA